LGLYKSEAQEARKLGVTIKAHDAIGDVVVMKLLLSKLVAEVKLQYPEVTDVMQKLAELSGKPILVETFRFGKHKGKKVADVVAEDRGYIDWMLKNMDMDSDLEYTIKTLLK
jgi:hypothetical protein